MERFQEANLHSNIFKLILNTLNEIEKLYSNLHSNIFKLILHIPSFCQTIVYNLHSNIFKLILICMYLIKKYMSDLHSNIFKLIQVTLYAPISPDFCFLFCRLVTLLTFYMCNISLSKLQIQLFQCFFHLSNSLYFFNIIDRQTIKNSKFYHLLFFLKIPFLTIFDFYF